MADMSASGRRPDKHDDGLTFVGVHVGRAWMSGHGQVRVIAKPAELFGQYHAPAFQRLEPQGLFSHSERHFNEPIQPTTLGNTR
jgi:hypothetical protein